MPRADAAEQAVEQLAEDLVSYETRADQALLTLRRAHVRIMREVDEVVGVRRRVLDRAQAELDNCLGTEERQCDVERGAVRRAAESLERARTVRSRVAGELASLDGPVTTFRSAVGLIGVEARRSLTVIGADLATYLGAAGPPGRSAGAGPASSSGATTGSAAGSGAVERPGVVHHAWMPPGFAMVSLSLIDDGDDGVTSESEFGKNYTPRDLEWAHHAFLDVVAPTLGAGMGIDDLRARDAAEGRVGTRSYADTYSGFLSDSAIKLDADGDGFRVLNGRHRIWVARRLGLREVPARVRG